MSFAKLIEFGTLKYRELEQRLAEEWQSPQIPPAEPFIIEDGNPQQGPLNLYVIWNAWRDLDPIERSEIIVNACEKVRGRSFVLQVSSATGLTTEEAEQMHLKYAPLEALHV